MKILLTLLTLSFSLTGFAKDKAVSKFNCGSDGHGTAFSVQFAGARYMDLFTIRYLEQDLKPLLLKNEQNMSFSEGNLIVNMTVGSCKQGDGQGNVLVSCAQHDPTVIANYGFLKGENLGRGFHQILQVTRNLEVKDIDLQVIREGTDAVLHLKMTVDTAEQDGLHYTIDRKLGTLQHDWYMCRFE